MKKIIKAYYPMIVSILFVFIYGIYTGFIINGEEIVEENIFIWIVLGFTILFVIGIWVEIICFIIHASKNKHLRNQVVWAFLIYFFNVFTIPYYNLKYVVKMKKVKVSMIVFGVLMAFSLIFGVVASEMMNSTSSRTIYIVSEDGEVQFKFNGNYVEREVGEYELYASDYRRGINVGAFIYTDDDGVTATDVQEARENWVFNSRDAVSLIDNYSLELDDKNIISSAYYGKLDGKEFVYQISTIEFSEEEYIVSVIQVAFYDDYDKYKEELKEILVDVHVKENQR